MRVEKLEATGRRAARRPDGPPLSATHAPRATERAAVDAVLGPPRSALGRRRASAPTRRRTSRAAATRRAPGGTCCCPRCTPLQARVGWISEGALNYICRAADRAAGRGLRRRDASTRCSRSTPRPAERRARLRRHRLPVAGARTSSARELERSARARAGDGAGTAGATWLRSPCLGLCEQAPAALVTRGGGAASSDGARRRPTRRRVAGAARGAEAARRIARRRRPVAAARRARRCGCCAAIGTRRSRRASTTTAPHGGYAALRRALELGPDGRDPRGDRRRSSSGRGGAAFPTGRKWEAVAARSRRARTTSSATPTSPSPARSRTASLMEDDPFAVVEAMTIAGFATGCERGYLYMRGEYPLARRAARSTRSTQARARGLLGDDVMGQGFALRHRAAPRRRRLHLRRGDGALQLDRGLPRRAAQQAAVPGRGGPVRQADGGQQRRDAGQRARRSCCERRRRLRGDRHRAARPGTQAVLRLRPRRAARASTRCRSATTLARAARRWPAACRAAGALQAVLLGGAAGAFVGPDELDMPLTFEGTRAAGATLGSGVVMVFDDTVDLRDIVLRIAAFFRDESCGQCVPCRVGTVRQEEALQRLARRRPLGSAGDGARAARRDRPGDARRLDLRPRPDGRRAPSSRRSRKLGPVRRERRSMTRGAAAPAPARSS